MTRIFPLRRKVRTLTGAVATALLATACSSGDTPQSAKAAAQWAYLDDDSQCVNNGGKLIAIHNSHPELTLRVKLDRWYMGVKTADRGEHELSPKLPPVPLGCSKVDGADQHWEVVEASFIR